jgi:undecaprenyl diphosphate synthase
VTPSHIAIIMDGNRRWARKRGLPVAVGYQRGVTALRKTLRAAHSEGIRVVTAFAFSEENWSRPTAEVDFLMSLCVQAAQDELRSLVAERVRVRLCGRSERLPERTRGALDRLVAQTAQNDGITLNLAINYGGRSEIGDAVRALVDEVRAGLRDVDSIDEDAVRSRLYTADLPDPDLVIRTGGESRMSNFLLFQAAYAEFWTTGVFWPDFGEDQLRSALGDFAARQRRYGT